MLRKITDAQSLGMLVNGHAPLFTGKALDRYIAVGINDDHECSSAGEAKERIRKGQWVMIREGTAARNLADLLPLFDEPWSRRCLLVTDDRHPADLLDKGHIDGMIRKAVQAGKSVITGIQMATIQAAQCFGLRNTGAVAPGYVADILVLSDLENMQIRDVYYHGKKVVSHNTLIEFEEPWVRHDIWKTVRNSFCLNELLEKDFHIEPRSSQCRIIKTVPDQLLTEEVISDIDFTYNNGIDINRDILKLAVVERHLCTGHIGLMSKNTAKEAANENENIRRAVYSLGVPEKIEPFMTTAFVSLPVIPKLKMTTRGLVDVEKQELISLFV